MNNKRPTVAHLMRSYLPGTCTFIYHYLTHIRRYRSIVLAVQRERSEQFPFPHVYAPNFSKVQYLLTRLDRRFLHRQRLAEPFFNRVIDGHPTKILHAHFGYTGVFALPLQFSSGLPLVTTFYGSDVSKMPQRRGWTESYRRLFAYGSLFLVEGSHLREQLVALGCPREKVQIQRIGVNIGQFSYRPSPPVAEKVRILMCGRFIEKKGFEYGIRGFAQIASEFPNSQLRIVGDGELRPNIEQLIYDLESEVGQRIKLLGHLDYAAYAEEAMQAHLFMAPSVTAANGNSEGGAPTVLLEMQARGLPVLSTYHADIPEVVIDGVSGYLVSERDDKALGEKLAELLAHPKRWDEMGRAGRKHIENQHDIVKLASQLEQKYDYLLEQQGVTQHL